MKRIFALLSILSVMCFCVACGERTTDTPQTPPDSNTPQSEDTPTSTEQQDPEMQAQKIALHGQDVTYDQFPIPAAEAFGLTGEDAILFDAVTEIYNAQTNAASFSENNTDFSMASMKVYEKSANTDGSTTYYGHFLRHDYYDLGAGLDDLSAPVYELHTSHWNPASLTLDQAGKLVEFHEAPESSNSWDKAIRDLCGPMTELADYFLEVTDSYSKEPVCIPDLTPDEMVMQYLNTYFTAP